MTDQENPRGQAFRDSGRWLWLGALTTFAVLGLASGRPLLAAGMLLLGVFAFHNNPLGPTSPRHEKPTPLLAVSWVCGLLGIAAIVAAAVGRWL